MKNQISYTECKTFGHAWDTFNPDNPRDHYPGWWSLSLRCVRCATERHDTLNNNTGELDSRTYFYPNDYKQVGIKLTKDELRVALHKEQKRQAKEEPTLRRRLRSVS